MGPVCHIAEMLRAQKKHVSFHTPGHKRAGADITELSYSDNLLSPAGVIAAAERDTAEILGAARTFFLTDGSTSGVFSMIWAAKRAGVRSLAVPVYSHRSVQNACLALGVSIVPVPQQTRAGLPLPPREEEIGAALSRADALLLTSPDYYGYFPPLEGARALCKAREKPLIIDGAHGAHLHFSRMHAGKFADMWVDGAHKSLPALTQGAAVSAASAAWAERLAEGVRIFRTTSPSYPILASVEYAFKYPRNLKTEGLAEALKGRLGAVSNDDWSKIVVPFGARADEAQRALEARGIYPEFNDGNYILFYLSPCTKESELKKLERTLRGIPRGPVAEDAPAGRIPIYSEKA